MASSCRKLPVCSIEKLIYSIRIVLQIFLILYSTAINYVLAVHLLILDEKIQLRHHSALLADSDHWKGGEHSYVLSSARPMSATPHSNPSQSHAEQSATFDSLSVGTCSLAISKWSDSEIYNYPQSCSTL